ncbi:MAG: DUF1800 family protein [Phycisphaera sp.]|nr:DUF1800 family protein [Phycisphaera sp.]
MDTSLQPIPDKEFGYDQARHLLARAGFGGTRAQVNSLVQRGPDAAIKLLVDYRGIDDSALAKADFDPNIIAPYSTEEKIAYAKAKRENDQDAFDRLRAIRLERMAEDHRQMGTIERWWLARMVSTPRPLEEKLTLLWHSHFASNFRTVEDSYLMLKQNELFRTNANGSFADMARGIVHDPAMLKFLNNTQNNKRKPNENLARELMELFTLGVGNYTEQDIKEGARALTGYDADDNDFSFHKHAHDDAQKTILGQTGPFDGDAFVEILLKQDACPRFVAYKLYRHFVADLNDGIRDEHRPVIEQLADLVKQNNYQIAPVLKTLFASRHFYDPDIMGRKIKSPVELVVGTIRTLNTPARDIGLLADALSAMGQKLFDPPSVAGWDTGQYWINTSTLFTRQNTTTYLITGKLPFDDGWNKDRIGFDPTQIIADAPDRSTTTLVRHLMQTLLGSSPTTVERRKSVLDFAQARKDPDSEDALIALLLLITAMPEYQLT